MEGLSTCYLNHFCRPWRRRTTTAKTPLNNFYYSRKLNFLVLASKDDNNNPKFDHWDQMELKFGTMIGEDPKLTLAKIMGRKLNPNVSYLEIEKAYNQRKKQGLLDDEIEFLPFDDGRESSTSLNKLEKKDGSLDDEIVKIPFDDGREASNSLNKLKLVRRPVPKEGVKFEVDIKPKGSEKKANPSIGRKVVVDNDTKGSNLPNVILRKPSIKMDKTPRMKIKPNLVLKMSKEEDISNITLLSKPKPRTLENNPIQENINAGDSEESSFGLELSGRLKVTDEAKASDDLENNSFTLLSKPTPRTLINSPIQENINAGDSEESSFGLESSGGLKMIDEAKASDDLQNNSFSSTGESHSDGPPETSHDPCLKVSAQDDESKIGLQPLEQRDLERCLNEVEITQPFESNPLDLTSNFSKQVALQGKPQLFNSTNSVLKQDLEHGLEEVEITQPFESNSLNSTSSFSNQVALQGKPQFFNSTNSFSKQDLEHDLKEVEITQPSESNSLNLTSSFSKQAALRGRPQRLDQSLKQRSVPPSEEITNLTNSVYHENAEIGDVVVAAPTQDREDADWTRAEALLKTEERLEVELISCSTRGFVASSGSLIGFLPYRNIATRWKFISFESWLRKKGLDPTIYKHTVSISGGNEVKNMTLDDLLEIYDQEKIKFLSSFIAQKIKVNVVLADRNSRRLMFSQRPKEKEELVEKKRSLMAKLSVGDIVKGCITKITYFGIFVEVEGVLALIHQSEVSWDAALNTSTIYKIGQIVEAKVHQLNFELERITLSLKEITPDPLLGALEFVVGDRSSLDERLEAEYMDDQWTEVESLIKELQQIEGVQSVSKGRFFLSPGLAPTFQVYMASMFETQYKLLARSGNKVQEVLVQASLDKEQMKDVVLTCTKRVE